MKRIAILVIMALTSLTVSAASIRYFTYGQATRTVNYLNTQNEMMIYCGYEYEIETYVLINEVWAERVNSSYYELWVFGYDAYTGEEIYMPLDLQCVWLFGAGHIYSAAQYLRFHAKVHPPTFAWHVPAYNPFTRTHHRIGYTRTYHYDVHCYGWVPPAPPHGGYWGGPGMPPPPMPYYYLRHRHEPAPAPAQAWTPGVERPRVTIPDSYGRGTNVRTRPSSSTGGTNEGESRGRGNTGQSASRTDTRTRGESQGGNDSRSSATTIETRSRGGNDGTTRTRSAESTTESRSRGTETATETRSRSGETSSTARTRSTGTTPTRENAGVRQLKSDESNTRANDGTATRTKDNAASRSNNSTATRSDNTRTRSNSATTSRSEKKSDSGSKATTSRTRGSNGGTRTRK